MNRSSTQSTTPILTYHSIDDTGSIISTNPEKFRAQMQHLANTSCSVISLTDIVTCIRNNRPLPPKSVAITFDDGFKNFLDIAYPILKEFKFTATVFLVPGFCGQNNQWEGQPRGIPAFDLLDWDEMAEMTDNRIDFGAHTLSHSNLSELPFDRAVQEIVESKSMIENHLGRDVLFFAYPYGSFNRTIKDVVTDKFYGACSTDLGFTSLNSDIYCLPRIDMYYFSNNNFFIWYGKSIFSLYIRIRSLLRTFRMSMH